MAHTAESLAPPGTQPVLFHMPTDRAPVYTVHDRDGRVQTRTTSLGVAVTAARILVVEHGTAWVRANDDTTARLDASGVTSDTPTLAWVRTLDTNWETTP